MTAATVIDFGGGNLLSVQRALHHCGAHISLAATAEAVRDADRIVLPGVGAFKSCIDGLKASGLIEPILEFVRSGRPFLGVCVGMQMMFDASEEFGEHAGLGLVPGCVRRIPGATSEGTPLKVPHIGWAALLEPKPGIWADGILHGIAPQSSVYFLHSFQAEPADDSHRLAECEYGGWRITAAVRRGNIFGCQFHPEKSGEIGLRILRSFLSL